jgi:AAA ATPase domain
MNAVRNPYAPGAGSPPPELAGRDRLREQVRVAVARLRIGRHAKSVLMVGLRGVGKTVLLDRMRADAEADGIFTLRAETPEDRSLPALLAPQLRLVLLRLSAVEKAKDLAITATRVLAGFVRAFKLKFDDIEVALDIESIPGLADNGDLEVDLATLFEQVGRAAQAAGTAVVLFLDEIQYIEEAQFAALISALHRCSQANLPLTIVGAGLPRLRGLAGAAKSYAERLFDFPIVGPLNPEDARIAILKPAHEEHVLFTPDAVESILTQTGCYPYFLQEWGKHSWDIARESPITLHDVIFASIQAVADLDQSFFRVRFDRLTPTEKRYLRAMAELGPGPHRSGEIAVAVGRPVNTLGPVRQSLILKGMLWSPNYGDTAFTVPLFDEFMKRIMPGPNWKTE